MYAEQIEPWTTVTPRQRLQHRREAELIAADEPPFMRRLDGHAYLMDMPLALAKHVDGSPFFADIIGADLGEPAMRWSMENVIALDHVETDVPVTIVERRDDIECVVVRRLDTGELHTLHFTRLVTIEPAVYRHDDTLVRASLLCDC